MVREANALRQERPYGLGKDAQVLHHAQGSGRASKGYRTVSFCSKILYTNLCVDQCSIIILLREPVGRALSDYENCKAVRGLPNVTIEELFFDQSGKIMPDSKIIYIIYIQVRT